MDDIFKTKHFIVLESLQMRSTFRFYMTDTKKECCLITQRELAKLLNLSTRTINVCLMDLKQNGYIDYYSKAYFVTEKGKKFLKEIANI